MIEGIGISKVFNDFWGRPKVTALKDVDISVRQGSVFGLLGPNGAGKSTLIKLLLGHLYPTGGAIRVLDSSPRDIEAKRRIGYLPERASFYTTLTAEETLLFFGRLLGLSDAESKRRSRQLMDMVGLGHASKRYVGEFSHGMKKRLGLAQSLLNDPDLLLLDEPTAGLDPLGCREIKDLIITLGRRNKTILMSSHLLPDVQDVCDSIMILYGGKVQATGPIQQLLAKKDEILVRAKIPDQEAIKKIEEILKDRSVQISTPVRSLEEYFLSVVAKAGHGAGDQPSGARAGAGTADYLTDGLDKATLDSLSRRTAAPPEPPPQKPVDNEILGKLSERPASDSPNQEPKSPSVDKQALDSLTKGCSARNQTGAGSSPPNSKSQ